MVTVRAFALLCLAASFAGCAEVVPDEPLEPIDDPRPCGRDDFVLAPPPLVVPGRGAIAPIDLEGVTAQLTLDVAAGTVFVDVSARFVAPAVSAIPVFQLLPDPVTATLDGVALGVEELGSLVVSDPARTVRTLPPMAPCSEHTLALTYALGTDDVETAPLPRLEFHGDEVFWCSCQEDGLADQSLELWVPSNLLFDRWTLDLFVTLEGTDAAHELVANGAVVEDGDGWAVSFPARQAHGDFWVLAPVDGVIRRTVAVPLSGGRDVTVQLRAFADDDEVDIDAAAAVAVAAIAGYDAALGPYLHGDAYLAWLRSDLGVSMEYEGATISTGGALQHEIAHSWYARGVAPLSEHHGWIDEGMATWVTGANPYAAAEVGTGVATPRLLIGEDDWAGAELAFFHYLQGALVFSGIAWEVGPDRLLDALGAFYDVYAPGPVTTDDLEQALYCELGDPYVRDLFHSRVRGLEGYPAPATVDECVSWALLGGSGE